MPKTAAAFKACLGVVALSWAMSALAQPAGTQAAVVAQHEPTSNKSPVVQLLKQQSALAATCGGSSFDVNTFINVDTSASADVKVTAAGVGLIEQFTDETGANIGPYKANFPGFQIRAFGGGLAPSTLITITITTFTGTNLTGAVSAVSTITFDCTNGVVQKQPLDPAAAAVPSLSPLGLACTAGLLLAIGALALRRIRRPA